MKKLFGKSEGEENNFWMSYTDLMSGFLIVFIFACAISYSILKHQQRNLIKEFVGFEGTKGNVEVVIDTEKGSIILYHKGGQDLFKLGDPDPTADLKDYLNNDGKEIILKAMQLQKEHSSLELRIEGHTDPAGIRQKDGHVPAYGSTESFVDNMSLSSKRANAVYSHLYGNASDQEKEFLRSHAISVGYSFSDRIANNTHQHRNEQLDSKSRRIEFRFIGK